jgi:hypothetical protein
MRVFSLSERAMKRAKQAMMMPISIPLMNIAIACGPRNETSCCWTCGISGSPRRTGGLPNPSPTGVAPSRTRSADKMGRSSILEGGVRAERAGQRWEGGRQPEHVTGEKRGESTAGGGEGRVGDGVTVQGAKKSNYDIPKLCPIGIDKGHILLHVVRAVTRDGHSGHWWGTLQILTTKNEKGKFS